MAKRYSYRRADGIVEYSDSQEELLEAQARDNDPGLDSVFAPFLGFLGFVLGGFAAYGLADLFFHDWPKVIRFLLVLTGAVSGAWLLVVLTPLIVRVFFFLLGMAILFGIGALIWKLI